jgi:hypothetical protein
MHKKEIKWHKNRCINLFTTDRIPCPIQYGFISKNSNGNGIEQPHFLLVFNRKLEHTHEGNTEGENNGGYVVIKWYIYESAVKFSAGEALLGPAPPLSTAGFCVGILSPAMWRGIDSRNWVLDCVAKLHRLAGLYAIAQPYATWFIAPIAGLKLPALESE